MGDGSWVAIMTQTRSLEKKIYKRRTFGADDELYLSTSYNHVMSKRKARLSTKTVQVLSHVISKTRFVGQSEPWALVI